jgi:putative transposase
MPEYRRIIIPGGTFFFTVVTWQRKHLFTDPLARKLLGDVFRQATDRYPFEVDAICLLPDHIHCIWTLPEGEVDYSIRWSFIKANFSRSYRLAGARIDEPNASRNNRREVNIWQRRFWDHMIRDEEDFHRHLDYIHYNPVKHGYVDSVNEWQWSSFQRYVGMGVYSKDWGSNKDAGIKIANDVDGGE